MIRIAQLTNDENHTRQDLFYDTGSCSFYRTEAGEAEFLLSSRERPDRRFTDLLLMSTRGASAGSVRYLHMLLLFCFIFIGAPVVFMTSDKTFHLLVPLQTFLFFLLPEVLAERRKAELIKNHFSPARPDFAELAAVLEKRDRSFRIWFVLSILLGIACAAVYIFLLLLPDGRPEAFYEPYFVFNILFLAEAFLILFAKPSGCRKTRASIRDTFGI